MVRKIPLIIDCDPGVDDAFALLYAFKDPMFDIKLISTVSGNVSIEKTTKNAVGLVNLANESIKVSKGSKRPLLDSPKYADDVHGASGLGNYEFQGVDIKSREYDNVVKDLYEAIIGSEEKVVIVAIGPFTNIARLLLLYPSVKNNISKISIMGGGIKGGNTNMEAEFNVYVDPEAAKVVFDSGLPIIMAGLDVTEKALFYPENLERVKDIPKIGTVINEIITSNDRKIIDGSLLQLNDVLSFMVLTNPEIFKSKDLYVDVELFGKISRGWTLADQRRINRKEPNCTVLLDIDHNKFIELLFERLEKYE